MSVNLSLMNNTQPPSIACLGNDSLLGQSSSSEQLQNKSTSLWRRPAPALSKNGGLPEPFQTCRQGQHHLPGKATARQWQAGLSTREDVHKQTRQQR